MMIIFKKYRKNMIFGFSYEFIKMVGIWLTLIIFSFVLLGKLFLNSIEVEGNIKENYNMITYNFGTDEIKSNLELEDNEWIEVVTNQYIIKTMGSKSDNVSLYSDFQWSELFRSKYYDSPSGRVDILGTWFKKDGDKPYYILIKTYVKDKRKTVVKLDYPIEERSSIDLEKREMLEKLYTFIYILIPVSLIIIFAYLIAKKFKKEITTLKYGVDRIINGEYDYHIESDSYVELDELAEKINILSRRLYIAKKETEKISRSKNQMLLNIAHDIRTPSSTIQGYSKALYDGVVKDENQKKRYLEYIYEKSKHVMNCIENIFKYSGLENNVYYLNLESVDINDFLRRIAISYLDIFEDNNIEINISIPEKPYNFLIDKLEMTRALSNLIDNAIKYNPKGCILNIKLEILNKNVIIVIEDNGIGIEKEYKTIIFDPLVRGDNARISDGGIGIGLSITKKIIELHNGKIVLINKDSKGAKFQITLVNTYI